MVAASAEYVRIIIRRPHAYEFRARFKESPIPGMVVLDSDGKLLGTHDLHGEGAARTVADLLGRLK